MYCARTSTPPAALRAFPSRRAFSSTWRWQYRTDWRSRLRDDEDLAACVERLKQTISYRATTRLDHLLDKVLIELNERRLMLFNKVVDSSSLLSSQCQLGCLLHPILTPLATTPVRYLETIVNANLPPQAHFINIDVNERKARLPSSHITALVGPVFPPWYRRSNISGWWRTQRMLMADVPFFGRLLRPSPTRDVIRILRAMGPGASLGLPSLTASFEHVFLPRLLQALSNPEDPVNQYWLEKHCADPVRATFQALRDAPKEIHGVADKIRYLDVVKVEWKGSHMSKELKQAIYRGDHWDATMDTPDLIYLVTLRAVSDLPTSADMATSPRELVCSMAISLLRKPDGRDATALEVKEVSLLSNESLVI